MNRATLLCSLLSLLALAACKPKKKFRPVGPGAVQDNVWRNEDLGLELPLPAGWAIQNDDQQKQLLEDGAKVILGDDEQLAAEFEAGRSRTISLFSAFEKPAESTVGFNPSLVGLAENLFAFDSVQTPEDYFAEIKKQLARTSIEFRFPREPGKQLLGGEEFSVLYASLTTPGATAHQRYFARRFGDHMVLFMASHETDEEKAAIDACPREAEVRRADARRRAGQVAVTSRRTRSSSPRPCRQGIRARCPIGAAS